MDPKKVLKLNPYLCDRVRLSIMIFLSSTAEERDFNSLLDALDLTKGNLSSHLRKLEEAKLVEVKKGYAGRVPRTTYRCTKKGRSEVMGYLKEMELLLRGMNT